MKPVPKNCSAITRKMATPIISGPNPGPSPYISSLGFLPRPSFSARARTRSPRTRVGEDFTARDRVRATPRFAGDAGAGRERDDRAGATVRDSVGRRGDADRGHGVDGRGESGHTAVVCHVGLKLGTRGRRVFTRQSYASIPDEGARFHGVIVDHDVVFHHIDPRDVSLGASRARDPPWAHHSTRGERLIRVSDDARER